MIDNQLLDTISNLKKNSAAVTWQVLKQQTVVWSSCEAEYQGLAAAVQEVIFFQSLSKEMGYPRNKPTAIGEDNQSAIKNATNELFHKRSKHIDTKNHFLSE